VRTRLPHFEIIALYLAGLSTTQVAESVGCSRQRVWEICAHVARDRSEAAKLRQPRRPSQNWRTCRWQARRIWEEANGTIPKGWHIHHRDSDFTNNAVSNLACLRAEEHMSLHNRGPEYHIPRHLRPARKAYMKVYLRDYYRTHRAC